MTEKIKAHHLARKAIVYVRQSSPGQVAHNKESQRLQYQMSQRVQTLGWQDVEVIDDDLGFSGSSSAARVGFQRMVAEVCLGKIGAVAAREVSRFARNNRDWHQLIEMCSLVDTLLVDHEAVYNPRSANDRLLLGLKGSLSEYELDLLRQRSLEARYAKARRGELVADTPIGFIKTPEQRIEMDPNLRVRRAIDLVFEKFFALGSGRQTLMWLVEEGVSLPARRRVVNGWETWWRRPVYRTIVSILTNPVYAGAYAYGRTQVESRVRDGVLQKTAVRKPLPSWTVLIQNHHEGYVSWEQYERIQAMLKDNVSNFRQDRRAACRQGAALLVGLLRCGRCSRKLLVGYSGRDSAVSRYICHRGQLDKGEQRCLSFGGRLVDEAVSREVCRLVQPGAIDAAVQLVHAQSGEKDRLVEALALEVTSARYEAERSRKQYDAVDPSNRLVADELERRWNVALETLHGVETRLDEARNVSGQSAPVDSALLMDLARDLEQIWDDPRTENRLKKRILRTVLREIVVNVDEAGGKVNLVLHWQGGVHTQLQVARRRRGYSRLHTNSDTVDAIRALALVSDDDVIAAFLNRSGLETGRGNRWTRERVASVRSARGIPRHDAAKQDTDGWMNLTQAATYLDTTTTTLRKAVESGGVPGLHPIKSGPWVFRRAELDQARARETLSSRRQTATEPSSAQLDLIISNR